MDTIVVRQIESRDASQAAKVWVDGLQQTIDSAPPEKRDKYAKYFKASVEKECSEGERVGPNGKGLLSFYNNRNQDCCMFVAVRNDVVLGLVGVKRGMHYSEFPNDEESEDYSLFSIWKLSVASSGRRLGIGEKLMNAAEEWVKHQEGSKKIRLYTGNPVAAKFYTSDKLGFTEIEKTDHYGIYEKEIR
jgi:ribosomal protein S18 acetylase RimI-like enzyme